MKVNLKGYSGNVKKNATVFSNDPRNPRVSLALHGTVRTLIDIRPTSTIFFRGLADQLSESSVDIVSTSNPFQIQKVENSIEDKVGYELETVESGKHYRLKVTNRLKQGNYSGYIKCYTDLEQKPDFVIRVSGYIEGEIAVKPQTVLVGKLATQQDARSGKVLVISNRNKPFQITKLSYDERFIQVTQQPLPKEPGYSLEITPKLENVAPGSREMAVLGVETDAVPGQSQEVQVHIMNAMGAPEPAASPSSSNEKPAEAPDTPAESTQKGVAN